VLSEHKTHTKFRETQRFAYPETHRHLIGLVRQSDDVPAAYRKVSWSELARAADRIAREEPIDGRPAGRGWRQRALEPEVLGRLRVLHELLSYIERSDVEVTAHTRIEHLDVLAYGRATHALEVVEDLFRSACGRLHEELRGDEEPFLRSQSGDSWGQRLVIESWADEYDFTWWAELIVSAGDRWREDGYDEPAFGAGLSFDHYRGQIQWPPPLDPARSPWARELHARGISVGHTDSASRGRGRVPPLGVAVRR